MFHRELGRRLATVIVAAVLGYTVYWATYMTILFVGHAVGVIHPAIYFLIYVLALSLPVAALVIFKAGLLAVYTFILSHAYFLIELFFDTYIRHATARDEMPGRVLDIFIAIVRSSANGESAYIAAIVFVVAVSQYLRKKKSGLFH